MNIHKFISNNNFMNNKSVSILSPLGPSRESRRKMNHCFSGYSCQSTNMTGERNISLSSSDSDTPSLSPLDSDTSTLSSSCLTRRSSVKTVYMPQAFRFAQSGRSMVEMLGVLAVMGVLSIGGIMGYSYGMDKYRANGTLNDINLRAIDLIAQASRGGDLSLAEWPTKTSADYDIGLEIDTDTNSTEGGVYVDKVPQRVCEIIADSIPDDVELTVNGTDYADSCADTNKMVFYYTSLSDILGTTCDGPVVDGKCEPCSYPFLWNETECVCPEGYKQDSHNGVMFCRFGHNILCPDNTVPSSGRWPIKVCLTCPSGAICKNEQVSCPDGLAYINNCKGVSCEPCPSNATYSNGVCICNDSLYWDVDNNTCQRFIPTPTPCGSND